MFDLSTLQILLDGRFTNHSDNICVKLIVAIRPKTTQTAQYCSPCRLTVNCIR